MIKWVLVVDDQVDNLTILRDLLGSAGIQVLEAGNGAIGVEMAMDLQPDLVLMDIQMPEMDVYETSRRIKAVPALAAVPIIAITFYALSGDNDKARAAGCDDYVTKSFSPRALLVKVMSWQNKGHA